MPPIGAILTEGTPCEVIDAAIVTEVYGVACEVVPDPVSNTPMIVPRGRHHTLTTSEYSQAKGRPA